MQLISHWWNEPGKVGKPKKELVSTCGVTTACDPDFHSCWYLNPETAQMDIRALEIPKTHLLLEYFDRAKGIDVFNHAHQGGLHLEGLATKNCWFRVFKCMVGTIKTSLFNTYKHFEVGKQESKHGMFTEELLVQFT